MQCFKLGLLNISFVIPVFNEEGTVRTLASMIIKTMKTVHCKSFEIIFIDDGSNDNSWEEIKVLHRSFGDMIKAKRFRRNFGKSEALNQGFKMVSGEIIFTMDADLQDDPKEIPKFLNKIQEGFDLVSGWKEKRNDPLSKTLPSKIFNIFTSKLSGIKIHDFNCGFKAYKREVIESINLYGELHRYIPVLAHELGFKVGEISVMHHPRVHGVSKYGLERYVRGFLDLLTVLTITKYLKRPCHLFGGIGILSGLLGTTSLAYLSFLWILGIRPIGTRPLLFFAILATILSVQLISFGLLAELYNRNNSNITSKDLSLEELGKDISNNITGKYK